MAPNTPPPMLTVAEVAAQLRRTPETVREWIRSGRLPASRPAGGHYLVAQADLDALLDQAGRP